VLLVITHALTALNLELMEINIVPSVLSIESITTYPQDLVCLRTQENVFLFAHAIDLNIRITLQRHQRLRNQYLQMLLLSLPNINQLNLNNVDMKSLIMKLICQDHKCSATLVMRAVRHVWDL
jgi:hypothetical protein